MGLRVSIERFVSPEVSRQLLSDHHDVFHPLDALAAEPQSLTDEMFQTLVEHPDVLLFIAWDDELPVGLMMATTDLELIPWIQPKYFRTRYPDHAARKAIVYVPTLQIAASHQGTKVAEAMCEAFALWIVVRRGVLCFDSCAWDIENLGVPQFIEKYALRHIEGRADTLDSQHYFGYEAIALKSLDLRDRRDHGIEINVSEPPERESEVAKSVTSQ